MTNSPSAEGAPCAEDGQFLDVEEYRPIAWKVSLLEQNARQVRDEILSVREQYADAVAHNWRAGVLNADEAFDAYQAGRAIGADVGITGWAAVWRTAGLPSVQRLQAMAAGGPG